MFLCITPLLPTVMVMGGLTLHPCVVERGWSMAYILFFLVIASCGNMSLQYVNSKNYIVMFGFGEMDNP